MTVSYDDLVTAATVGITRKPLALTRLSGPAVGYDGVLDADDPAAALLDAAALLTVARRAGAQPRRGVVVPAPPADSAPALSARAEAALRELRWFSYVKSRPDDDADVLASLLGAAAAAGYVATGKLLTDLLNTAAGNPALHRAVAGVLGARGRWLAQYNPGWQDIVAAADLTADPGIWHAGSPAERLAYLSELREHDPAAARDLLAAAWAKEHGRERARFIAVLSGDLSPADEEFLEQALSDRAPTVHAQVTRMLARLLGSAFRRRASERAAGLLRLEGDGPGSRLAVTLPGKPDAAAARDGVAGKPPASSIRPDEWRLSQLLAAAPLSDWTARFGLSPREIVALPADGSLRADVLAGWRLAAISQGDPEWARALLDAGSPDDAGGRPPEAWPPDHEVAAALPPGERATVLLAEARLFHSSSSSYYSYYRDPEPCDDLIAEVAAFPAPWPADLADAVIAAFQRERRRLPDDATPRGAHLRQPADALLRAAGRCLPAAGDRDYAAELVRVAGGDPHGTSGWDVPYRFNRFTSAAKIIMARRAFYEEIS